VQRALIELRKRMGHSQSSFARAQNVATATVGRWESVGEPGGITLAMLEHLARKEDHKDLAKVFSDALTDLKSADPSLARSIFEEQQRRVWLDGFVTDVQVMAKTLIDQQNPIGQQLYNLCNEAWKVLEQIWLFSWRDR
jgi:transcriptional regulator with XRE-family HTH domain